MISKCCKSGMVVVGGDEGTNHYECEKCGSSCDEYVGTSMKTREELKAEVLKDIRKAKVKDQVTLQVKLRQVVRTRLAQPTQKERTNVAL